MLSEGPSALTLKRVAASLNVSHPAILHHFGSADQLMLSLQQKLSRQVRQDFLELVTKNPDPQSRLQSIDTVLAKLSEPRNGRIIVFLLSTGVDPFPPMEEKGLEQIFQHLQQGRSYDAQELHSS